MRRLELGEAICLTVNLHHKLWVPLRGAEDQFKGRARRCIAFSDTLRSPLNPRIARNLFDESHEVMT